MVSKKHDKNLSDLKEELRKYKDDFAKGFNRLEGQNLVTCVQIPSKMDYNKIIFLLSENKI